MAHQFSCSVITVGTKQNTGLFEILFEETDSQLEFCFFERQITCKLYGVEYRNKNISCLLLSISNSSARKQAIPSQNQLGVIQWNIISKVEQLCRYMIFEDVFYRRYFVCLKTFSDLVLRQFSAPVAFQQVRFFHTIESREIVSILAGSTIIDEQISFRCD